MFLFDCYSKRYLLEILAELFALDLPIVTLQKYFDLYLSSTFSSLENPPVEVETQNRHQIRFSFCSKVFLPYPKFNFHFPFKTDTMSNPILPSLLEEKYIFNLTLDL